MYCTASVALLVHHRTYIHYILYFGTPGTAWCSIVPESSTEVQHDSHTKSRETISQLIPYPRYHDVTTIRTFIFRENNTQLTMSTKSKRKISNESKRHQTKKGKTDVGNFLVQSEDDAQKLLNELKHSDPVLQLHLGASDTARIPIIDISQSSDLLATLIYPLSPSLFLSSCFRKKAVHICSNNRDRAKKLSENHMFELDAKKIFEETSSDCIFLWIPSKSNGTDETNHSTNSLLSIEVQDPNTAHVLHTRSNYASYCRAPPELEQMLVSHMLLGTGLGLGQYDATGEKLTTLGRGEVETFIGTKGHLTDWHTDFQENFTIQLSGRKKWTLKQGTVKHPIRGVTPHYRSSEDVIENQIKAARLSNPSFHFGKQDLECNAFGNEVEIIMDAGDVLYFPAGMWHKVETLEYGVSINISLMGSTYASLICRSLEHILLKRDDWREVICSNGCSSNVLEKVKALMSELPKIIQEFAEEGGAEGIIPPTLRQPPLIEITLRNDDVSDEETGMEDNNCVDDDTSHEGSSSINSHGDEDNVPEHEIIDVQTFEHPEGFVVTKAISEKWRKNPLASLIRFDEIHHYYNSKEDVDDDRTKDMFILNVNFAGNDMHESSVRTILHDDTGLLDEICSLDDDEANNKIRRWRDPPAALIYFGLIV